MAGLNRCPSVRPPNTRLLPDADADLSASPPSASAKPGGFAGRTGIVRQSSAGNPPDNWRTGGKQGRTVAPCPFRPLCLPLAGRDGFTLGATVHD